ncbi:hypothetical protein SBRCBS47491_005404 [Sporothrix bragantina]|uniref:BZIP transcription factor n=1 Tax=Sporothrix bragantina TaxID=671064 RepID=A0ABP0BX18_9PEZI
MHSSFIKKPQQKNKRFHDLEQEVQFLRAQVNIISAERDELRKVLGRVSSALGDRMPYIPRSEESNSSAVPHVDRCLSILSHASSPTLDVSSLPVWMSLPVNSSPVTPLDTLIVEFQAIGARLRDQGFDSPDFAPDAFPNVAPLLDSPLASHPPSVSERPFSAHPRDPMSTPPLPQTLPRLTVSSIIVGHISMAHGHQRSRVSQLAAVWSVFSMVRWRMCRSQETFNLLPAYFHPTALQLRVPHQPWVDVVPWPAARDSIIRARLDLDPAQDTRFRYMLIENTIVLWDRPIAHCVVRKGDGENGKWVLSRDFENHLRNLKNWCLPQEAIQEFPFLQGAANVTPIKGST